MHSATIWFMAMVFNTSLNNISAISWWSGLLVEKTNNYYNPVYHPSTHINPLLRLGLIWGSRDVTRADMEKVMY